MAWDEKTLTIQGIEMLRRCLSGEPLTLDYAAGGDQIAPPTSLVSLSELTSQKQALPFGGPLDDVPTGKRINILIASAGLTQGYTLRQVGIWAHAGQDQPQLFAVIQDSVGIQVYSEAEFPDFAVNLYFVLAINASNANIYINLDSATFASVRTVQQLIEQHNSAAVSHQDIRNTIRAVQAVLDGGVGKVQRLDIFIPTSGWTTGEGDAYHLQLDLPLDDISSDMIPALTVLPDGWPHAVACGLAPFVQTVDGAIRLFANSVPSNAIPASLTLQEDASSSSSTPVPPTPATDVPVATTYSLGVVRPGPGLTIAPDGTLSIDSASDEEIESALSEIFDQDKEAEP